MTQASDGGAYFPENINKIEEQKKSCSSIKSSDTGHGVCASYRKPSSSEVSIQPVVKLSVKSVEGAEPLSSNVNISLKRTYNDIDARNEVPEGDDNIITYQRVKRVKETHPSDLETTDLEANKGQVGLFMPGLPQNVETTFLDQPIEFESETTCSCEMMSEKRVTVEDQISVEVENKLMEEHIDCCLGVGSASSNNDNKVLIDISNKSTSENSDALGLAEHTTEKDIVFKSISAETDNNDALTIHEKSSDADMPAIGLPENVHHKAKESFSNVKEVDVELEEENIGIFPRLSSGDALGGDAHIHHDEQSVACDADLSVKHLDGSKGDVSEIEKECRNVAVDKSFAGYKGKKLLVLDVNGLLVDISSYVPYDYDPDDIILRKAVFKRPYCDDFLRFCFERFNVGVWTSKTRRNMEPILDFLLGNDKSKLLFCWDQSYCTHTGFYTVEKRHKPLLLKKLKKLWDKCKPDLPWERGLYNESNTLLLDDTPYKALCNPRYTAIFPYTYRFRDVGDNSLGPVGDLRVYLEGLAMAENVQEYVKQNPFGQRSITEKNLSWGFYLKVIEASSTPPRQTDDDDSWL